MEIKIGGSVNNKNGEVIRVIPSTSAFPVSLDISPFAWGSALQAIFYTFPFPDGTKQRIEIRRKENMVSIFIMEHSDTTIDPWWQDSELIWELK